MYYKQKTLPLKDNRTVTLRSPIKEDAKAALTYMRRVMDETAYLSSYPDEIDMDMIKEEDYLHGMVENPRALWLSAYDKDGEIAGNFDFRPIGNVYRYAHRAEFGIAVVRDYWGSGLASALMQIMLCKAKEVGFEQVELEVSADNARAIALYQKFGFVQTGILPRFYKYRNGIYADAYYMVSQL